MKTKDNTVSGRPGFTLIEILVVVAIIALLISILLPSLQRARAQAKSVVCQSNARQLGLGMTYFNQANRGYYPDADMWLTWTPWYWTGNTTEFTAPLANPTSKRMEGYLLRYVGRNTGVFLCPSDDGYRAYASPPPAAPDFHAMPPGHTNFSMQYSLQKLVGKAPLKNPNLDSLDPINNVYYTDRILMKPPSRVMIMFEESELSPCNDGIVSFASTSLYTSQVDKLATRHNGFGNMLMFDSHVESIRAEKEFNDSGSYASRKAGMYYDLVYRDSKGAFRLRKGVTKNEATDFNW